MMKLKWEEVKTKTNLATLTYQIRAKSQQNRLNRTQPPARDQEQRLMVAQRKKSRNEALVNRSKKSRNARKSPKTMTSMNWTT